MSIELDPPVPELPGLRVLRKLGLCFQRDRRGHSRVDNLCVGTVHGDDPLELSERPQATMMALYRERSGEHSLLRRQCSASALVINTRRRAARLKIK